MTTGEKIARLRKQAGMSQEVLAEKLGISRQAVSKWENGTAQPANDNLLQIARLFNVTISSLLDGEDVPADSFSTQTQTIVENKNENQDTGNDIKKMKILSRLNAVTVIILGITNIIQGYTIGHMKNDIATLNGRISSYSTLERQIAALESRLYSNSKPDNENFTDYHYKVLSYDRDTNMATLYFSVVPKDYTQDTQAEIVIKSAGHDYNVKATMENNLFVAQAEVYCEGVMDVYLYLTENGKTRSFILDSVSNPASAYMLEVDAGDFDGNISIKNGQIKIDGHIDCFIRCTMNEEISKSVYPVKATIEFYDGNKLFKTLPYEAIMNYDYISIGKQEMDMSAQSAIAEDITFGEYFEFTVEGEDIKVADNQIGIRIVVADNHGYEYISDTDNYRCSPLVVPYI